MASLDPNILNSNDEKVKYSLIYEKKNEVDEDIICDVCLNDIVDEGEDELVICDLCNTAVHQKCYGHEIS